MQRLSLLLPRHVPGILLCTYRNTLHSKPQYVIHSCTYPWVTRKHRCTSAGGTYMTLLNTIANLGSLGAKIVRQCANRRSGLANDTVLSCHTGVRARAHVHVHARFIKDACGCTPICSLHLVIVHPCLSRHWCCSNVCSTYESGCKVLTSAGLLDVCVCTSV